MPPSNNTSYAERERHRQEFYARHRNIKPPNKSNNNNIFAYSEKNRKFVAPLALVSFSFAILFTLAWLFTSATKEVVNGRISMESNSTMNLGMFKGNSIYKFRLRQDFSRYSPPKYSELEIEILDENNDHVYSVFKNLWQEFHSNDEGGRSVYSDVELEFELEIEKKGNYAIRAISHDDNRGDIRCRVNRRDFGGHLYFGVYAILFGLTSLGIFLGRDYWGNPSKLMSALPKMRELKSNKYFLISAGVSTFFFVACVVISYTHYGYASAGEVNKAPSSFSSNAEVIYLG
jgi:hypothetical protein